MELFANSDSVPALFTFRLTSRNSLEHIQTLKLPGNTLSVVLDITDLEDTTANRLLVSIDTFHKPGSTTEVREAALKELNPLRPYKFRGGHIVQDDSFEMAAADQDEASANSRGADGKVTNLLYNLEPLRKRDGEGKEE